MASPGAATEADLARSRRVEERLRAEADPGGFLRFDRFVEGALYAEGIGYYASTGPRLGPTGDFLTAPQIDPAFGAALARRILSIHRALGAPERFTVAELGPGDGTLAEQVAEALAASDPGGTEWTYLLVDRSEPLRELSVARLSRAAAGGVEVRCADTLGADGPFRGVVVANEFLDALPFRRLVFRRGAWRELGVRWDGQGFRWAEGPGAARHLPPPLAPGPSEGAITELSEGAEALPRAIADTLVAGSALLIDYGYGEDEYLRGHPDGSLRAVRAHRADDDPLSLPGLSDLSAYVRWDRLRARARDAGLTERSFERQREALGAWGYPEIVEARASSAASSEEAVRIRLRAKNLLFGFENFWILELGAGAPGRTAPHDAPAPAPAAGRRPGPVRSAAPD